jgi:hypothetical protein
VTKSPPLLPLLNPLYPLPFLLRTTPIKGPITPPPSPFRPPARDAAKTEKFLVGARRICGLFRSIPTTTRSPAALFRSPSPSLALAHLSDPSSLFFFAVNRANPPRPNLDVAWSHSGRVSSSLQDALQHLDQAPETALTR